MESKLVGIKGHAGGPETFQEGLMNLATEMSRVIISHTRVKICATGGYKPESAVASILGFISGSPVYYIHTTFNQVVHLPSLPLDWRYEIKKHKDPIDELLAKE